MKGFVNELRSAEARAVLACGQPVISPEQGEAMVRALRLSFDRLAPAAPLSERALELALISGPAAPT